MRNQMLTGTFQQLGLIAADGKAGGQFLLGLVPHGLTTVIAMTMLLLKGACSGYFEGCTTDVFCRWFFEG